MHSGLIKESLIINCTSIGSKELFHDDEFMPLRGQLVYLAPQENVDYFYADSVERNPNDPNIFFVFLYPLSDRLVLGGAYEFDQDECAVTTEVIDQLLKNGAEGFLQK